MKKPKLSPERQFLFDNHKKVCEDAFRILQQKNSDYASNSDPYANFRRGEYLDLCSVPAGILLRVMDKLSRLSTFVKDGKLTVKNESYDDACKDIINYLIILMSYVESQKQQITKNKKAK